MKSYTDIESTIVTVVVHSCLCEEERGKGTRIQGKLYHLHRGCNWLKKPHGASISCFRAREHAWY